MFALFKTRDFGDYVSDTFLFFRQTGKHYLKTFFTICGPLLLVLAILTYFLFQVYLDFVFNIGRVNNDFQYIQSYAENNSIFVILGGILIFLFIVFLGMLTYSIPVIYMDLYAKKHGNHFDSKELWDKFKANFGKILLFFLCLLFLITPILIVVFFLLILLCFILIGIPLIIFAMPTALSWVTLSFYHYLNDDRSLFRSFEEGFKNVFKPYFPNVGSLIIIYIIIQIAMSVFTFIPYLYGLSSFITPVYNTSNSQDALSTVKIMMSVTMVAAILMSYILNNMLLINQGLVYYSRKENKESISSIDSIDLIGSE